MSELNNAQKAAVAVRRNAVVTAGAGSGKTRVLAERYLALVEEGISVEQILCLTFTRKAAAEMYERIYRSLLDRQERSEAARQAVREFEKAQISTLDSFSGRIVRSAALQFGLNPDFAVDEEELRRLMEGESLRFLLRHGETEPMQALITARGFDGVWRELLLSLAMRHFSLAREESLTAAIPKQRAALARGMRELLEAISGHTRTIAELDPGDGKKVADAIAAVESLGLEGGVISQDEVELQSRRLEAGEEQDELLGWIWQLTTTLEGIAKPGPGKKEGILLLKEIVGSLREECEQLRQIGVYLDTFVPGLMELLEEFRRQVLQVKRQRGCLSYQDVVELSIAALKEDPELREFYKSRFSRIMIDEFQDNNNDQRELLFLLSEAPGTLGEGIPEAASLAPEKLFFVGDEKQSIYRFRGADVSVFKGLAQELSRAGGLSLELTVNYRSEPALIDGFNALFEAVFGEPEEPFDARFQPLEPRNQASPLSSRLHLALLDGNSRDPREELSNAESEAFWIARTIQELLVDPEFRVRDRGTGELRRPTAGDVAVLFRSTGNQYALERMLRLLDIPYGTQSIRSFFIEAPAYDIYAFLQTLIYPEDRLAYATLLRSPFFSVGDDTVLELLLPGGEAFSQDSSLISDPGDRRKYELLRERWEEAQELVDRRPTTELIDYLWYDLGYRELLLSEPMNHPYLEHYDYLFQLAKRFEDRPMEEFLRTLRGSLGAFERLEDLEIPQGEDRVQLITIHKSKGLEFPVVFVMDIGNTGGNNRGPGYFVSEEYGLLVDINQDPLSAYPFRKGNKNPGNYFVKRAREKEKLQGEAELRRLLYVAATRAESHLYFTGYLHSRNTKSEEGKSILQLLAGALGIDLEEASANGLPESALQGRMTISEIEPVKRETYYREFGRHRRSGESARQLYDRTEVIDEPRVRRRILPSEVNSFARARAEEAAQGAGAQEAAAQGASGEAELGPLFAAGKSTADGGADGGSGRDGATGVGGVPGAWERALGTLTHRIIELEIHALRGGARSEPDPEWVTGLLKGATREEVEGALEEARGMAARFLDSDLWRSLAGAERIETELSVLARYDHPVYGELLLQGQFDLYAEIDGRCEVIDFKTDRELKPEEYMYQLSLYREAAEALSGLQARSTVFGLRDGRAQELAGIPRKEMDELLAAYVVG